jgi:tRNA 2-thiocytidine biosynthesis protein TtcA
LSYAAALPVVDENCPACFEAPRERQHIKKLLAREEAQFPNLFQVSPPRRHEAA